MALPGAGFIQVAGERIRSVQALWDQKTFVEQLGLQAIVLPYSLGPCVFGSSVRTVTGRLTKPSIISLT